MKTKYQTALENSEIPQFFKGIGQYFSPDPDWGDHLHIRNWSDICLYLETKDDANKILEISFVEYLESLQNSYEDAESLAYNISGYYYSRKSHAFMSKNNYDLLHAIGEKEKYIIVQLFKTLRKEYTAQNIAKPVITLNHLLDRIRTNGCGVNVEKLW